MDDQENAIESIKYALEELLKLRDTAFFQYAALVNQVIEKQITGEQMFFINRTSDRYSNYSNSCGNASAGAEQGPGNGTCFRMF